MATRAMVPALVLFLWATAATAQQVRRYVPHDSLSPSELVQEWVTEMSRPTSPERPARTSVRTSGITRALRNYRSDPARAAAVRDELESVALRPGVREVRCLAIYKLTSGYAVGIPEDLAESADTRDLALRLERLYETIDHDGLLKRCVMGAVSFLGGSGRLHALTWLEPLIIQETDAQAFPNEAFEAMRTAVNLGQPGRVLVVRLRDQGLIQDPEARFRSGFISVGGG